MTKKDAIYFNFVRKKGFIFYEEKDRNIFLLWKRRFFVLKKAFFVLKKAFLIWKKTKHFFGEKTKISNLDGFIEDKNIKGACNH